MKRCMIYLAAILSMAPVFAEKLPSPVKLEVAKSHIFSFDKESLADGPYFCDKYAAGSKFSFDGESLNLTFGDNVLGNNVKEFIKTHDSESNSWQYIITLDNSDSFPTQVEMKFVSEKEVIFIYPQVSDTGDFFGVIVSECKVIP